MTVLDEIAAFAVDVTPDALPDEVRADLRRSLLFNLAVARAGHAAVGATLRSFLPGGDGPATVFVTGERGPAEQVTFANAFLMHARAQDDFQHAAHTHLGAVTVPALLAVGQSEQASGSQFLVGLAVAYQVSTVLGSVAAWETSARGLRATPVYGPPGAAAGVAAMCRADRRHVAAACGLAANSAVGFSQTWVDGTDEWRVQVAGAAQSATRAHGLARAGLRASDRTFEGDFGVFPVLVGRNIDPDWVREQLRGPWATSSLGYKAQPVCGINLGPVANASRMRASLGLAPDEISAITLRMRPEDAAYPGIVETGPFRGPGAALMSAPYTVALALVHGTVDFRRIEHPTDADALALAARTRVEVDDALDELSHVMEITDTSGSTHRQAYRRSSDEGIWDLDRVRSVVRSLAEETGDQVLSSGALEAAVDRLEKAPDLSELVDVMCR